MSQQEIIILKIIELACVVGGLLCLTRVLANYFDRELILAVWPYVLIPLSAAVSIYTHGTVQTITGLLHAEAEDDDESF